MGKLLPSKLHSTSLFFLLFLLFSSANSEEDSVKQSLVAFLRKLSITNARIDLDLGWTASSDPCLGGNWTGVSCNDRTNSVRKIALKGLNLDGSIDASLLSKASSSLVFVALESNSLQGPVPPEIGNCSQLTHLLLGGNRLSGSLPSSISGLKNLKKLDISGNGFTGELPPGLANISGLVTFLAQNNQLNGTIPPFDFANLNEFNVSYNRFTGPVPEGGEKPGISSFLGNPGLCGGPLSTACPPVPPPPEGKSKSQFREKSLLFSGYILLGLAFVLFLAYKLVHRRKASTSGNITGNIDDGKKKMKEKKKKKKKASENGARPSSETSGYKTGTTSRSEYSLPTSTESAAAMSLSLVVLRNPATSKELTFEDLLRAPAELLGRGRFGSLYKVMVDDGTALVVKRIKDWAMAAAEFQRRVERIDRSKHPNVLPPIAFYCSKQEKLVVYEYKRNGSLFNLLHGSQEGKSFDWESRLNVAAGISQGLAFMHTDLYEAGIAHGNLKSSNIMMDSNMLPCISEYGLLNIPKPNLPSLTDSSSGRDSINIVHPGSAFMVDVYGFGVILLELLTGKLVDNNGFDLARWVHSVVREEWTVEVFDKALISEAVSEEGMVRMLQLALKCINPSPDARPSMTQVAAMVNSIKEEEDRSAASET